MAKKIEKLTSDQISRFPEFVEKWTKIGLCTDAADRPRAEAAIRLMYQAANLPAPKKIVWCGSPLSQGFVRAIILDKSGDSVWASVGASVRDSVRDSVWDSVRDSVWAIVRDVVWHSVRDSVRDSVWDSVRASVGASVWAIVWHSVWDSVRASVGASVWAIVWHSVWDSVRASVGASVWDSVYGNHDAGWLSFYKYFEEVCLLKKQTEKLTGLWELAQSAGWVIPHAEICWVSERHCILERNERGQLHCISGPSVAYPDGWAIYAINGVRVPEYVIMSPEKISVKVIEKEENAEVRRVMIDRFIGDGVGVSAYLKACHAEVVDHDERFGTLRRKNVRGDEPIVMVEVVNRSPETDGSFKHYFLRVPPNMSSAHEAVAWTFGKTVREYYPEFES